MNNTVDEPTNTYVCLKILTNCSTSFNQTCSVPTDWPRCLNVWHTIFCTVKNYQEPRDTPPNITENMSWIWICLNLKHLIFCHQSSVKFKYPISITRLLTCDMSVLTRYYLNFPIYVLIQEKVMFFSQFYLIFFKLHFYKLCDDYSTSSYGPTCNGGSRDRSTATTSWSHSSQVPRNVSWIRSVWLQIIYSFTNQSYTCLNIAQYTFLCLSAATAAFATIPSSQTKLRWVIQTIPGSCVTGGVWILYILYILQIVNHYC